MKEKEKIEHELKTIADIFDVLTDENCERFFIDFCLFVHQTHLVKKQIPEIEIKGMLWTDDGEHKITGYSLNGDKVEFKGKTT